MKKSFGAKTLAFPNPVWCVGSYDTKDQPNLMTIAWGGICCSSPPAVTISLRKATYTYGNIIERKAYTINIPSKYKPIIELARTLVKPLTSGKNQDSLRNVKNILRFVKMPACCL